MAVYSYSRLNTFRQCPRKYYFEYVARISLEEGPEPAPMVFGTCVHKALETLYRRAERGRVMSADELAGLFVEIWGRACGEGRLEFDEGETAATWRQTGIAMLQDYHRRYAPFNHGRVLGLERRLNFNLGGDGRHRITGVIDRLEQRDDGTYEIHDYKTGTRLPEQAEVDADGQLALYQIGLRKMWKDARRVELVWHYLRHGKELRSTRTDEQLAALKRETVALIEDIESRGRKEARFETRESGLCDWCDYQHLCPLRRDRRATAELPAGRFLKESGVRLVDRYAELTAEIEDLQERIAALESRRDEVVNALLDHADRERLEIIVGSEHEACIAERTAIILPTKGESPEAWDALDAKLRGSKAWPEVSTLDPHALRRIWSGRQEDPGGVKRILRPFVREETVRTVRLQARKDRE